jgi:hypothetical protein
MYYLPTLINKHLCFINLLLGYTLKDLILENSVGVFMDS